MRVLVRLDLGLGDSSSEADGVTKLLRIEDSGVSFAVLLGTIAAKLGVTVAEGSIRGEWELYLEGEGGKKALVEDTSEIDDGDMLVLRRSPAATIRVKREGGEENDDGDIEGSDGGPVGFDEDNHDDGERSVETVPYEAPEKVEVIEISDDTEDSDCSSDDSSDDKSSGSEEDDEDDEDYKYESDSDDMSYDESEGVKKSSKPIEPPLQVHMNDQDVPTAPGKRQEEEDEDMKGTNGENFSEAPILTTSGARRNLNIDQEIKNRIVKLLNTGFHDGSNEHEAKKAMKHAQRLMKKHNLSQALLLKERDRQSTNGSNNDGSEVLKGGLVRVRIVYRKTQKPSQMARWIAYLMTPVADNFDVKCYKSVRRGKKCSVTFYGIYTNCQLAAYAFRVAVERISQMVAGYKPVESPVSTRNARLSYALGIERGIDEEVKANIQREKERRERKLERARKAVSRGEAYEESDDEGDEGEGKDEVEGKDEDQDDDDDDGAGPGFSFPSTPPENEGVATMVSPPAVSFKRSNDNDEENGGELSGRAMNQHARLSGDNLARRLEEMEQEEETALALVNHQEKVADEVLKERGIKLHKGRKRKSINFDRLSYDKGIIDSKEIDINQRAIRDDWTKKVKKEEK